MAVGPEPWTALVRAGAEKIGWPGLTDQLGTIVLALLQQLEQSETWSSELIRSRQFEQLGALLGHAFETVQAYHGSLSGLYFGPGKKVDPQLWARIPILGHDETAGGMTTLLGRPVPEAHGSLVQRGGVLRTDLAYLWDHACELRWQIWHGLDPSRKLCVIRDLEPGPAEDYRAKFAPPNGWRSSRWELATGHIYATGPSVVLDAASPVEEQAVWLAREEPAYLLTTDAAAARLARHIRERDVRAPSLDRLISVGDPLDPVTRELCTAVFGCPVIDLWSRTETGALAARCPAGDHHHVHAEAVLVEVVDQQGRACPPGARGRVLATPLHNFATVLLRYDLGVEAELAEPACRFGLPTLKNIRRRAEVL